MAYLATLYKARGMPLKQNVCAICVERTRGHTVRLDLGYGVHVWLCRGHASAAFQTQRSGRDFILTLSRLWQAHGCLTHARSKALHAHNARLRGASRAHRRPGSYAWPMLRRDAEQRFAAGAGLTTVATHIDAALAGAPANTPSHRTLQRWRSDHRWITPPTQPP